MEGRTEKVQSAMRYGVLNGGKRLRPILTLAVAEIFGVDERQALVSGCAIELVHCASLILDDLPSMDDAQLRRGRKACHREFDESTAILASFGLLNRAFQVLQELKGKGVSQKAIRELTLLLTAAIGTDGLIGGQIIDLESEKSMDYATLEFIHSHKTIALFLASAEFGCVLGRAGGRDRAAILQYAKPLGLAFQIQDDLLDALSTPEKIGKDVNRDVEKTTFVSFCGIEGARQLNRELIQSSIASLAPFGKRGAILEDIGRFSLSRRS